ncbi:cell division protein FtsX [Marinicella litoralis]|uniref:Cell division protein FtsX n=1 Tax=Marinicella litoralis TaxID=644220 RepID=A0A4R6XWS4_9GAMM|nr:FtsX-like permease family protein [Marinicella litoralis]TDR22704.1 cell division protein FtsX [Marinicella litoralis]
MNQIIKHKPNQWVKWYRGHIRAMVEGFKMPMLTPYSSLFTVITLAICFYLPLVMWTLWQNFSEVEDSWRGQGSMAVFLKQGLAANDLTVLQHDLLERNIVIEVSVVDKDTIKASLNDDPQLNQVIDVISSHELPDQILVQPHPNATSEQLQSLAKNLQLLPDIDYVSFDAEWFNQLKSLTQAFYYLMQASIVVFLIIILVFLSHSIGSEVALHKKEISLQKLLGASPGQIRRRFLYGGLYYGLLASMIAIVMLRITLWYLEKPIADLSQSFGQSILIRTPYLPELLVFILLATLISWLGARVSASNHIANL